MKSLSRKLNEALSDNSIWVDKWKKLWIGSGEFSGITINIKKVKSITDKYDCDVVNSVLLKQVPLKTKSTEYEDIKLYSIPMFNKDNISLFGGINRPSTWLYLSVVKYGKNKKDILINIFDTKNEAFGYHQL